jgi:Ser/Thr protein kinase RdoA (MazF antagonist)
MLTEVPSTVFVQFGVRPSACAPVGHLGFSGSMLWRVRCDDSLHSRTLCLKRWSSAHPPPARLPWIHRVLQHAGRAGIDFVPEPQRTRDGQSVVEEDGSTWELMTWLPGEVESRLVPSPTRLQASFRALAKFHQAAASLEVNRVEPAPAVSERLGRWQELNSDMAKIVHHVSSRRIPEIDDLAQQWLAQYAMLDPRELTNRLRAAERTPLRLQPAIRDIWRDHVLFTGDDVTGVIDFGAMRIDTPLTDLARLIGSLTKDDVALRRVAFDAYAELCPLSAGDLELVNLLDDSGTLIAGWNWLEWLYVEQRQFPSLIAVRARMSELLARKPDA